MTGITERLRPAPVNCDWLPVATDAKGTGLFRRGARAADTGRVRKLQITGPAGRDGAVDTVALGLRQPET